MVNVNKLKGKIVEKGMTVEQLARKMGVNKSTIYRKLNNAGETFTIKDANLICSILGLTGQEAAGIFFNQYVA